MKSIVIATIVLLGLLGRAAASEPEAQAPLTLGFMPYLNAEHLIEKYQPLADYLARELGRPVQIKVARDYAEHIRNTGEDRLDIAFLGGSPYVAITERYGPKPLLARYEFDGKPSFRSVIFVAGDSPLQQLAELAGKRVAFGSIRSTLSTQVPVYMLIQAGVRMANLSGHEHLRNHENVVLGVRYGDFDAGAVAEEVYRERAKKDGIRILAQSQDLSTHLFVTRSDLPKALVQALRQALTGLAQAADGKAILSAIGPSLTGFVPVADSDYDLHRQILSQVLPELER